MNFFRRVNFIFLVVGHTKNACDCLFNLLKLNLRKKDVFTFDELLKDMNIHKSYTAIPVKSSNFLDIKGHHDTFYHKYSAVLKHHIFICEKDSEGRVTVRESNLEGAKTFTQDLRKNTAIPADKSRQQAMFETPWDVIPDPGVPNIKQCEMFNKWRPLIPDSFQEELCPKPLQSILEEQKTIKKEKQKLYVSKKKKGKIQKTK
jgi:hypothetical protein